MFVPGAALGARAADPAFGIVMGCRLLAFVAAAAAAGGAIRVTGLAVGACGWWAQLGSNQ
jgi:hypothetical protein